VGQRWLDISQHFLQGGKAADFPGHYSLAQDMTMEEVKDLIMPRIAQVPGVVATDEIHKCIEHRI